MTIVLDGKEYLNRKFPSSQIEFFLDTTERYFVLLVFDAGIKLRTWYLLDKLSITIAQHPDSKDCFSSPLGFQFCSSLLNDEDPFLSLV